MNLLDASPAYHVAIAAKMRTVTAIGHGPNKGIIVVARDAQRPKVFSIKR